jgi:epoxide hydrolase-like predicted phosphatase
MTSKQRHLVDTRWNRDFDTPTYNPLGLPLAFTMTSKPKVLLFDIGGVCVVSPFKAILEYEQHRGIPTGYINYNIRELTPNGAWHKLERGEIPNDAEYMRLFKADLQRPDLWAKFNREKLNRIDVPPMPEIDTEVLYWTMMSTARVNDPFMYPALQRLKAAGWKLAAMSNTTLYPEGHAFNEKSAEDVRDIFEVFVSSAHVGMRKPNRDIYEYTLGQVRERWGDDIQPEDVLFLDDIGENLKMGKKVGFRTIRVFLGKTDDAVRELEKATGESLLGSAAKARL